MLYLVTGPEKSGKSARAEQLAVSLGEPRVYLATMIPYGDAGQERISRHRRLRAGQGFLTIERPRDVSELAFEGEPVVLLECLLNLVANEWFDGRKLTKDQLIEKLYQDILTLNKKCRHLVVVTGTMESADHYDQETKEYIEIVDQISQKLAQAADQVISSKPEQNAWFPVFMDLSNKKVVIAGGGKIASRRAAVLAEFGAAVFVAAPVASEEMLELNQQGWVHLEQREFRAADLEGAFMVIAATNDAVINDQIALRCREKQIMINHAGDKRQCSFYFPGAAKEGCLSAGVTASGSDHKLAKRMTEKLREWLTQFT